MLNLINNFSKKMDLNKYNGIIKNVNELEIELNKLSDKELFNKYIDFRNKSNNNLSELLTISKILAYRFTGLNAYNTQLKAALVLNSGFISEQGTGEGKTLSVLLSILINYAYNKNIHIVTANDYLVERDYSFSKKLFDFLNIKSDYLFDGKSHEERKNAYNSDVLYSTSKHLAFDYLHNNRFKNINDKYNERRDFVIIDEIDFVLIDEARTPIVLSGVIDSDKERYVFFQKIYTEFNGILKTNETNPKEIENYDFVYTQSTVELTEKGYKLLEKILLEKGLISGSVDLYDGNGFNFIKSIETTLRANYLFRKDIEYLVNNDEVVLINTQTGRPQPGRRFSGGLHQALEAKENVVINNESKSLAQTTLQNYFKKYNKIAGTTGTALTEEVEFKEFYNLKVLPIEANKKSQRIDAEDLLFLNNKARMDEIVNEIKDNVKEGRPTLIGTLSVSSSEELANRLQLEGIPFELLNAKNHEREAYIIQQAGKKGAVTISTNMAGRGTDIMLGGNKDIEVKLKIESGLTEEEALNEWNKENKEVLEAGGLSVIGVGRNGSRRLDNQLIGRCGRQGDPGYTRYYLSLDDEIFINSPTNFLRNQWGQDQVNLGLSLPILSRIIREAQKAYEGSSFQMRKTLLRFDNVNAEQRDIFYDWRNKIVNLNDFSNIVENYFNDVIENLLRTNLENEEFFANDFEQLESEFKIVLSLDIDIKDFCSKNKLVDEEDFKDCLIKTLKTSYIEKMSVFDPEDRSNIEKNILLDVMDENFAENISNLESMRTSTNLRSYAQKNPIDEYQKEALEMFSNLIMNIKKDYCLILIQFSPMNIIEQREMIKNKQEEKLKESDDINANNINLNMEEASKILPQYIKGIGI